MTCCYRLQGIELAKYALHNPRKAVCIVSSIFPVCRRFYVLYMRQWGKHSRESARNPRSGMLRLNESIVFDVCRQFGVDIFIMEQLRPPQNHT